MPEEKNETAMPPVIIPKKDRNRIRDNEIRALYKEGYSMQEIAVVKRVSKTTVFFAINNRYGFKKRAIEKGRNKEKAKLKVE